MSLPGVGAAAALPAETSLRRLSFIGSASREHRLSANVREGDRFLSFSSFSQLCVWAEDASYSESGRRAASLSAGKPPSVFTRQSHDGQSEHFISTFLGGLSLIHERIVARWLYFSSFSFNWWPETSWRESDASQLSVVALLMNIFMNLKKMFPVFQGVL